MLWFCNNLFCSPLLFPEVHCTSWLLAICKQSFGRKHVFPESIRCLPLLQVHEDISYGLLAFPSGLRSWFSTFKRTIGKGCASWYIIFVVLCSYFDRIHTNLRMKIVTVDYFPGADILVFREEWDGKAKGYTNTERVQVRTCAEVWFWNSKDKVPHVGDPDGL